MTNTTASTPARLNSGAPSRRQRVLAHPATLALAAAGSSTNDLADALGVTQSMASRYLAGRRALPERFARTLTKLVGAEEAAGILARIPGNKAPTA